jgi:hypothetical protein
LHIRITLLIVAIAVAATLMAAPPPQSIQITAFEAAKGVDLPPALVDQLVKQLTESKKFAKVLGPDAAAADPSESRLKLVGVVTNVDEGSRAARAFVGFGAGAAHMSAHVKFVDAASGDVKFESDTTGKLTGKWSMSGGQSMLPRTWPRT